jgi:hypothetical protein
LEGPLKRVQEIYKAIAPGPTEEDLKDEQKDSGASLFKPASPSEVAKRKEGLYEIDFEKIVPGKPGEGDDGYHWSIQNWGTKWNAYDMEKIDDHSMQFDTAWSMPEPVIRALSKKFPDVGVEIRWADEDLGSNCGEIHYKAGEETYVNVPDSGSKEAYEIAFDVKGWGAEDYVYDKKLGTYVYKENESRSSVCQAVGAMRERFNKLVD